MEEKALKLPDNVFEDGVPAGRSEAVRQVRLVWDFVENLALGRAWFVGRAITVLLDRGESGVYEEVADVTGLKRRSLQEYRRLYLALGDFDRIKECIRSGVKYADIRRWLMLPDEKAEPCIRRLLGGAPVAAFKAEVEKGLSERCLAEDDGRRKPPAPPAVPPVPVEASVQGGRAGGSLPAGGGEHVAGTREDPVHTTFSGALKKDASGPDAMDALAFSIASAVKAAETHSANLDVLVEKLSDTDRTSDDEYRESYEKALKILDMLADLGREVEEMADKLLSGVPAPGSLEAV